jgi:hypothetical protein
VRTKSHADKKARDFRPVPKSNDAVSLAAFLWTRD